MSMNKKRMREFCILRMAICSIGIAINTSGIARAETVVTGSWLSCISDILEPQQTIASCSEALEQKDIIGTEKAFALYSRGLAYEKNEEHELAYDDFTSSLQLNPNVPPVLNNRSVSLKNLGRIDEALVDLNLAISIATDHASAFANRAEIFATQSKLAEAFSDIETAIRLEPTNPDFFGARGRFYWQKKDASSAEKDFSKAIELDPANARNWNNRGYMRSEQGNYTGALADYDKALEIWPNYESAIKNRAAAAEKMN